MSSIPSPGEAIGPYRVLAERGRGGMAVVLEVEHAATGDRRALKLMLPGSGGEALVRRFQREFRALSRLRHPGVLEVFESGLADGRPWFAMELLDGRVLGDVVEDWRGLPPAERFRRSRKVLIELARALEYIHARGLVHRDVTPSNIMVLPDGRVKLMDFGVVKEAGEDFTTVGEVVGTVAYIAPEQINGGQVDARADLYSLGAVFYLLLTGRRPFNSRTLAGYMEKHLNRPVRPPRELVPTIPELADEVCLRLLAKKPSDRFASATHLLHVLHASVPPGAAPGTPGWSPHLVGRGHELGIVRAAVERLSAGQGGVILIEGDDGMGRNRLAAEADQLARRRGLPSARARARGPDQRAYETWRAVVDDLLREKGEAAPPALAATFGERGSGGARVERYAVLRAMGELLTRSGPRLVLLHDLQRADRGTIELAEYVIRNLIGEKKAPLLIIITRPTPPVTGDPLEGLADGTSTQVQPTTLELRPLPEAAVEEMLLGMLADGPQVRVLAARLHAESNGNPFVIAEMVRALFEDGRLVAGRDGGRGHVVADADALQRDPMPVPGGLREVLRERLAPLDPAARSVAVSLAVVRDELDFDLLGTLTHLPEDQLLRGVDALVAAGLAVERRVHEAERISLARNRVRTVVLEETAPELTAHLHNELGDALERRYGREVSAIVELLAWHYEEGQHPAKAVPYLIQAGRKLVERAFVSEALAAYDRAMALEPAARRSLTLDDADRRLAGLHLDRAQALGHLGRWPEAEAEALAADALARDLRDPRLESRTAAELAVQARRRQQLDVAQTELRRALQLAEGVGDKRLQIVPMYEYGAVLWARGDLEAARDYFVQALASSEAYQDERSLALGTNGLGLIALCKGQSTEARRYFEQSVDVCERHGMIERLTVARINLVEVHHLTGNLRKSLELADRTVAHAREVDHRYGIALGLRYRVLALTDIGRLPEAVDNAQDSLEVQRAMGNAEDLLATLVVLARALLAAGEDRAAADTVDEALELAEGNDAEGFEPVLWAWRARLWMRAGDRAQADAALAHARRLPGRQWPHQQARYKLNLARAHEALGHGDAAADLAEEALRIADSCGYRFYAMRARQVAARCHPDEAARGRHARVGAALARSLAAGLDRDDADQFLLLQGIEPRPRRVGAGPHSLPPEPPPQGPEGGRI